ncbi:hypothetical protein Lalb_Chr03g0042791 [Lupinus albus]|uniref:Uncharacterized protein n=1 Tax=Lupinus albus TaxID=3870 RepID=A0A6A4QWA0_LUPAL|nr:hypothetical protein Lalb_Chr03g0042791 [Lupinus albus]
MILLIRMTLNFKTKQMGINYLDVVRLFIPSIPLSNSNIDTLASDGSPCSPKDNILIVIYMTKAQNLSVVL